MSSEQNSRLPLREPIVRRVRALLQVKIKNGATPQEAIQAAALAQRLMAKYSLEEEDLTDDSAEVAAIDARETDGAWVNSLAGVVADAFRCRCYFHFTEYGTSRRVFTFVGRKADAEAARAVYEKLYIIGARLGRKAAKQYKAAYPWRRPRGVQRSACEGFVSGVKAELEKQSRELMLTIPAEVNEAFEEMTSGFSNYRARGYTFNGEAYSAGVANGMDAVRGTRLEGQHALPSA